MSPDLQQYNDIIEELKSHFNGADFDMHFKQITADIPKAKQFLIKMELKRLAKPSTKQLDLRGRVPSEAEPFQYKGVVHYLDKIGQAMFAEQVDKFGMYTTGVYEAVDDVDGDLRKNFQLQPSSPEEHYEKHHNRSRSNKVQSKKTVFSSYGGKLIPFGSYGIRNEERMNFSVDVELQFGIGDVLRASTSDLSVSGAKIKIPANKNVVIGQKLGLYLTGLEQKYDLGLKDGIQYEIVGIDEASDNQNYIRMKRTFDEDVNTFDDFLGQFINGNKQRYKVDLENTLEAVTIKGYEQYYLPRITSLPIFLRSVSNKLVPTMVLATENNQRLLGYFSDENRNLVLQSILNEVRIKQVFYENPEHQTTLYCFTHAKQGKLYFYSATETELNQDPNIKQAFLAFGSKKPSWEVFNLTVAPTNEKDSFIPLSIPNSAGKEIEKLNTPPSPRVKAMLKDVSYIATLTALEGQTFAKRYSDSYQLNPALVKNIQKFGHPKLKRYINIAVETVEYVNLRSEERFLYKSAVEIYQSDQEDKYVGGTRDFSAHGLQVVLDSSSNFKKGDVVLLNLVELQKITKKLPLEKLPYEIMAISRDKTIVNLRVFDISQVHNGVTFFKKLISQNKDKLTPAKMESKYPGLGLCLRNLVTKSIANLPIYFSKVDNKLVVSAIGHGVEHHLLLQLLSFFKPENYDVSIYPLVANDAVTNVFLPILSELKREDRPKYVDLLIKFDEHADDEQGGFTTLFTKDYDVEAVEFISHAANNFIFAAFRIYLSRTGRPDMSYVSKELHYISRYAKQNAKNLEQQLWAILGVGDVVNCTEEILNRFNFDKNIRDFQTQKRRNLYN